MADKIRVNYAALEDMAKHCDMVAARLNELSSTGNAISQQMSAGALLGEAGDMFTGGLSVFQKKVKMLADKFTEEAGDIRGAISDMQTADNAASGKF